MPQIQNYLTFGGNAREAMNFYKECFNGDLNIMTVGESPIASQCPTGMQDQVMHSTLMKDGNSLLMASDMVMQGKELMQGNNFALSVNCNSEEEINSLFKKLGNGGTVIDPLKEQFWGAIFGVLNDKFGIRWMFNYEKNQPH
jgi:PhnB protein